MSSGGSRISQRGQPTPEEEGVTSYEIVRCFIVNHLCNYTVSVASQYTQVQQECIPVGCVPPAAVAVWGGSLPGPPGSRPRSGSRPSQEQTPLLREQTPPDPPPETCCKACWDTTCNVCWDSTPPVNRILDTHL